MNLEIIIEFLLIISRKLLPPRLETINKILIFENSLLDQNSNNLKIQGCIENLNLKLGISLE